ncbi:heme ABC exporter ATP-binding protein CcmA [Gammaproteobacteria bacterium]|jgi:heme exporter protein A|nr:heme ABC exporter ATP-binding protein CcmA [Pseudomonadota bacterium]MDC0884653.1 heme ABC exporter ATP-binding protein CcmA [Gammaproteobacteria bacterium]
MKLFSAQNITYSINENKLFHNLSFEINSGEGLHIKGGNGSGKSTLLRIILGVTSPSKGLIQSYDQDLKISYLGHKNAIKNYLTPIENLDLLFSGDELNLALEWLNKFGLSHVQDELTASLSFGQQKKLALIRVLAQSSDLLVLDEPFVGLDQTTADELNSFLAQKISQGMGLILTSHITPMIDCKVLDLGVKNA